MAEKQFGEDLRLHFAVCGFLQATRIARLIRAVRVNLRSKEQRIAVRGPSDAVGFRREGSESPWFASIEGKNPNLGIPSARGDEGQRFAVRGPTRTRVRAIAAGQLPRLAAIGRNHPKVADLLVGGEIH